MNELEKLICEFAAQNVGQQEKPNNSGFINPAFEKQMTLVGFNPGESWCCLFAELCWSHAFGRLQPAGVAKVSALFSESCLKTWSNAKTSKDFKIGMTPKAGAVALFQHGTGWTGHAAIVTSYDPKADKDNFLTIEGNTNAAGGREGIEVARKKRPLTFAKKPNALNLLGFIYPC